jgi:MFS family permease
MARARAAGVLGVHQLHRPRQSFDRGASVESRVWSFGIATWNSAVFVFWTYASFQIVSGWLVDRFDVKWVMAAGFFLWSTATAVTGVVRGFVVLLAVRLVLGIGESVAFPSYSKILARFSQVAQLTDVSSRNHYHTQDGLSWHSRTGFPSRGKAAQKDHLGTGDRKTTRYLWAFEVPK